MLDIYRVRVDIEQKKCCACNKESKCNVLKEDIKCIFVVKPELRKVTRLKTVF
jgi:hypothetical protein